MTKPNFFIVGAPKSGTSALAQYLSEHRRVFFSQPKEPFFWCEDYQENKAIHSLHDLGSYLRLFERATPQTHLAIGEGSTTYLQSKMALNGIRLFNDAAKIIVMLRNPVEVVVGMHGELLRHGFEDQTDFATAWDLQEIRKAGQQLPRNPTFTHQLQYRDVANYPDQLNRLFSIFPASQRHVILFDDFKENTRETYRKVLQFLDLPDNDRNDFPTVHPAKVIRNRWLARLHSNPPPIMRRSIDSFKNWYYRSNGPLKRAVQNSVFRKSPRPPLSDETKKMLIETFRNDIRRLSIILGRDLDSWCESVEH